MLVNLALMAQNHARMVADGVMSALVALLYQDAFLSEAMTTNDQNASTSTQDRRSLRTSALYGLRDVCSAGTGSVRDR